MKQLAFALALLLLPALSLAQTPDARALAKLGFHHPKRAIAFVEKLRAAVQADDRQAVAGLMNYPLSVSKDGQEVAIETPEAFLRDYASIISPAVRKALLEGKGEVAYAEALMFSSGEASVLMAGNGGSWLVMFIHPGAL